MRLDTMILAAALLATLVGIVLLTDDLANASAVRITSIAESGRLAP